MSMSLYSAFLSTLKFFHCLERISTMASYLASYANPMIQQMVQDRIVESTKQKMKGRVEYALQYNKDDPLIYLGDPDAAKNRDVLIIVRSPMFWSRLLAGADLVSLKPLDKICLHTDSRKGLCRVIYVARH